MDNTQPLRIVNGQFMRGNNIIEPEIGNREQIECLQAYEEEKPHRILPLPSEGQQTPIFI